MKKVGVITFWYSQDNYGQILQLYAMQEYLRHNGYDPYVIRFDNRNDKPAILREETQKTFIQRVFSCIKNPGKIITFMEAKRRLHRITLQTDDKSRRFDDFRDKHITFSDKLYNTLAELKHDPPAADAYLCGSDVIWKESVCNMAYFLDFGPDEIIRIAYAPSFGANSISTEYIKLISTYLNKFRYIGVRENTGVNICDQIGVKSEWVPDPTLLLDRNVYQNIASNKVKGESKYIFVYLLNYPTKLSIKEIFKFAEKNHLEVLYVASQGQVDQYEKENLQIEEWLGGIANAEYVITNSFHCCAFSIIFNVSFSFISLNKSAISMNDRVLSLLEMFNIPEENVIDRLSLNNSLDWNLINAKLETIKNKKYFLDILK